MKKFVIDANKNCKLSDFIYQNFPQISYNTFQKMLRKKDVLINRERIAKDMQVKKGDFITIIGSNGAGKSTLIKTMTGAIRPTEGKIFFEGKEVIGEGANGKVYRLDPDTICKAFKDASHIGSIENEIAMAKKAFIKGIPTAIPFDVVRLSDGGYGCVYELLKSDTMNKLIVKNPEKLDVYINMYANVLKTFLNSHIEEGELPRQSDYAKTWCKYFRENKVFDEKVCDQIDKLIYGIPEKDAIVHGDFHLKNLMFQGEEPIIIDMDTLGTGHPVYELGYLYYSLVIFDKLHPDNTLKFFEITYDTSCDICKKIFHCNANLLNHMKYHDAEQEKRKNKDKTNYTRWRTSEWSSIRYRKCARRGRIGTSL